MKRDLDQSPATNLKIKGRTVEAVEAAPVEAVAKAELA